MTALVSPVAGAVAQFDPWDVDGRSNAYRDHGDALKFWHNGGSGDDATPHTADIYGRPLLKLSDDDACVAFDGINDGMDIPSSDSTFNFIHTAGIFDLFLCFRAKKFDMPIFGNTNQSSIGKGFTLYVNTDGSLSIALGDGSAGIVLAENFDARVPLLTPTKLLIRGDGTSIKCSQNFFDFESKDFTGSLTTGDAARVYTIGETKVVEASQAQADFFWVSLYDANLNQTQLDTMSSCIRSRAGSQA